MVMPLWIVKPIDQTYMHVYCNKSVYCIENIVDIKGMNSVRISNWGWRVIYSLYKLKVLPV